ncbi:hypothetical protein JRO89_XS05G0226000 [Xanthoceras sorbifolium]|uniref:Transmembrane protein 214-A n=1 Tax=Xanthoceras sorbifolium TaxID=99658 RepID=A0ABQ8I2U0_9ROSI|nr:hypothetical protein JRO89_XS05G0226000 [Xanthoceras sorbifolium]
MEPGIVESNVNGDAFETTAVAATAVDHGWQKVTYAKRQKKTAKTSDPAATSTRANGASANGEKSSIFRSLEQHAEERRRRIVGAQQAAEDAAAAAAPRRSKHRSDDEDEDSDAEDAAAENGKAEETKKPKQKKPKKPKITVAEAAAKIDAADLGAFLVDVSIPLSHISNDVYKTSADWINQRSPEALGSFILWSLDSILADLETHLVGAKGSKKAVQQASSKSQVAMFLALAMVLRRKPDVLASVLPTLKEKPKYQGQDKLTVIVWMITQASQGELAVGLYSWAHNLLPIVGAKSCNPQSRDIILQLVERILSTPKARTILVNGAVKKGERLMPPSALETLLRLTFPPSSARVKATERFEAIYPVLKEVALAGAPGSKAMKQVAQQILSFAIKAAGESMPELSREAAGICIWCLTQNADCYKQWDKVYQDNLEASVAILKKISEEWKQFSVKLSPFDSLRTTLQNFRHKNEQALDSGAEAAREKHYKNADKYCKTILGRVSRGHGCLKSMAFLVVAVAVGYVVVSPNMESLDWKKLSVVINSQLPF